MNKQDEIEKVHGNGIHLVILGAGASLASTLRNPELNGKQLPLMNNIVEIVGLNDVLKRLPVEFQKFKNQFEKLFSMLYELEEYEEERLEMENSQKLLEYYFYMEQ